ncbi:hypothetical protein EXS45_01310 [Candidatus Nomurabacteria bacterium]|nr:hypothetical protein [Candidatus Nomurabacteria bacterium]
MKISNILKVVKVVVFGLLLITSSGCAVIGSGNIAKNIKPPVYKPGEEAVITKEVTHIAADGKTTKEITKETKTGLAVAENIELGLIDVAKDVGVARANQSATGYIPYSHNGYGVGIYGGEGYGGYNTTPYGGGNGFNYTTGGGAHGGTPYGAAWGGTPPRRW